ncbi:MAG TPA: hypothetical protein VMO26_18710 [Vicinamibacterales bacterium]|nr:hypothetical protein [Vicinamibacterales bacterium]
MKRALPVVALILGGLAHPVAQSDVLATLGTNTREAHDSIFMSLTSGFATLAGERSVFKAAAAEARAGMVRAVVAIARSFAASPEFARRYALYRQAQMPRRSETARTGSEAMLQQQQAMELAIKQATANAAQMPADARKQLEDSIADMRKQIDELNADPEYRAAVDRMAAASAKQEDEDYAQKLALFNTELPEDVNVMIARRLRHFLLACSDVDFDARLEMRPDKKMRFVNPAYERRSAEWKMCFRAGKPAVDAARAEADEWLEALAH